MPGFAQCRARLFGPPVLPHDCVVNRRTGFAVPDDGGFSLVGNAHCADIRRPHARPIQGPSGRFQLCAPDFHRVMLDPARLRVNLREFLLGDPGHVAGLVEDDAACAGGPLVECEYIGHGCGVGVEWLAV
jgi:hypothetical protein